MPVSISIQIIPAKGNVPRHAIARMDVAGSNITRLATIYPKKPEPDDKPTLRIVPLEPEPEPDEAACWASANTQNPPAGLRRANRGICGNSISKCTSCGKARRRPTSGQIRAS